MGTRHLTMVVSGGTHKIAQYGQWDGYPEGQGLTVLQFCRENLANDEGRAQFGEQLEHARFITDDERRVLWTEIGVDLTNREHVSWDESKRFAVRWPSLDRDTGAKVLNLVAKADAPVPLTDSADFAGDSLFCEWAYVVDLDRNTLEVYKGFNTEPVAADERFAQAPRSANEYHPVRHQYTFALDTLPTDQGFVGVFSGE